MVERESMSRAERQAARRRFRQDHEDAEYVEYTFAMGRIDRPRRWKRRRHRFLRERGYPVW